MACSLRIRGHDSGSRSQAGVGRDAVTGPDVFVSSYTLVKHRESAIGMALLLSFSISGCLPPRATPTTSHGTPGPAPSVTSSPPGPSQGVPEPRGAMTSLDVCGLIEPEEAAAIVGGPSPVPEALAAGGWAAGQCAWTSPVGGFLVAVGTGESIRAFGDPAASDAVGRLETYRRRSTSSGFSREIPDIGDGAVLGPLGLASRIGTDYIEILRSTLTDDQLVGIARLLTRRLERSG
jgi:hypothetical protein